MQWTSNAMQQQNAWPGGFGVCSLGVLEMWFHCVQCWLCVQLDIELCMIHKAGLCVPTQIWRIVVVIEQICVCFRMLRIVSSIDV